MAGTDSTKRAMEPTGPAMVLVGPQMGENIGAAARAMWNFGLNRMRLVSPRDGWPNPAAVAMASGAGALLDNAQLFETTRDAIADCHRVYATTARPREMTKRVVTPEQAMTEIAAAPADQRTAILFGAERAGLANEDIVLADTIITVPVNPAFASLNLGQCALLVAYEWRRATTDAVPDQIAGEHTAPAKAGEVAVFLDQLVARLDQAGFFFPENKRPGMEATLRNLFHRAGLTGPDVRTLWGVVRSLSELRNRKPPRS